MRQIESKKCPCCNTLFQGNRSTCSDVCLSKEIHFKIAAAKGELK